MSRATPSVPSFPSELSRTEQWRWLAQKIRCALMPNEPQVFPHYRESGEALVKSGAGTAWGVNEQALRLLILTAYDRALPWRWRLQCLEHATRTRAELGRLARLPEAPPQALQRLSELAAMLARMHLEHGSPDGFSWERRGSPSSLAKPEGGPHAEL